MTNQCKFGNGNRWHIRLATGTGLVVTLGLKLSGCKTTGRSESEHEVASKEAKLGRPRMSNVSEGCYVSAKEPECRYAPPVFQWWQAVKAIQGNSGEHTASSNLIIKSSNVNMRSEVAHPITQRGNGGNALCVVGIVRSTDDSEDSITSQEGRDHTRNTIAHNSGETHSRKGRRS